MEFMLDTANLGLIKKYHEITPLVGVTTNPSILTKEGDINLFDHLKQIRKIIGQNASLHVQVVSENFENMMKDAKTILEKVDKDVYIKVPVSEEGLKVIKALKAEGVNVSATTIYTQMQGYLAIAAGADYIIPYYNRMENQNINPDEVLSDLANAILSTNSSCKILAASFKNIGQVNKALEVGTHAVTVGADVFEQTFTMPAINKAISDFTLDWTKHFGSEKKIYNL